jgi:hypothetical protein
MNIRNKKGSASSEPFLLGLTQTLSKGEGLKRIRLTNHEKLKNPLLWRGQGEVLYAKR